MSLSVSFIFCPNKRKSSRGLIRNAFESADYFGITDNVIEFAKQASRRALVGKTGSK